MHCSACSTAVEAALEGTVGVSKASVSLTLSMADVTYNPKLCDMVCAWLLQLSLLVYPALCPTFQHFHTQ